MKNKIRFGIGFVTGRSNVCRIINSYYEHMLNQVNRYDTEVELTIFVLFDLAYQNEKRQDFYNIKSDVYKNINIIYITPEDIGEEIKKLTARQNMKENDMKFFFGNGHAKGRNTLMYFAMKNKMNYILFWDDDEYPVAVSKEGENIKWIIQDNVLKHLEYMRAENADVTIGYHCGYISPIPYIDFTDDFNQEDMKTFIEAISNDIISWESIQERMMNDNGVTYANKDVITGHEGHEIQSIGGGKWVAGSSLCLNLDNKNKIPSFYNPPLARGEDTFFSTLLGDSKTVRIPVYHFHDGFLKYTEIMDGRYPKILRKINVREERVRTRFYRASVGWIKYKPLLCYITDKEHYQSNIMEIKLKLKDSVLKLNKVFSDNCFDDLTKEMEKYDKEVEKHYEEYKRTDEIWTSLKELIF